MRLGGTTVRAGWLVLKQETLRLRECRKMKDTCGGQRERTYKQTKRASLQKTAFRNKETLRVARFVKPRLCVPFYAAACFFLRNRNTPWLPEFNKHQIAALLGNKLLEAKRFRGARCASVNAATSVEDKLGPTVALARAVLSLAACPSSLEVPWCPARNICD